VLRRSWPVIAWRTWAANRSVNCSTVQGRPPARAESEVELEARQVFGAGEFAGEFPPDLAEADEF
jgi:hypothetical protein